MKTIFVGLFFVPFTALAHSSLKKDPRFQAVIAELSQLKAIQAPIQIQDSELEVGISFLNSDQQERLLQLNHSQGKCGGFELLAENKSLNLNTLESELTLLRQRRQFDLKYSQIQIRAFNLEKKEEIQKAIEQVSAENLEKTVRWLSQFPNRNNRGSTPNAHVEAFKNKIEELMSKSTLPWKLDLISHRSTQQKSTRLRIEGKTRPNEIIVLGGHYDSINQSWSGDRNRAPGADDNASGSANLFETLRLLSQGPQPERSIEFFWYAGEESGLLGSSEIASDYKAQKKDVIAVLQLDMTAYPGEGELVIGNVTDNTSPWLHDFFNEANRLYLGARIVNDRCGYACSDHASWYRQGYATLLPFEAVTQTMNPKIHTPNDTVENGLNFKHAKAFSQLALIFAMELANTNARQP